MQKSLIALCQSVHTNAVQHFHKPCVNRLGYTVLGGTALYRLHVNSWSVVENVIHSKGLSHNGDVVISCTALFINKVC